jgi:hypothetical protein
MVSPKYIKQGRQKVDRKMKVTSFNIEFHQAAFLRKKKIEASKAVRDLLDEFLESNFEDYPKFRSDEIRARESKKKASLKVVSEEVEEGL